METNKTLELIAKAKKYTYAEYRTLTDEQVKEGMTANPHLLDYTKLNAQRMKRLDKTVELQPEVLQILEQLKKQLIWVVITEGWCGDAAQNVPVISKIAEASAGRIKLDLVLRDQNLELMDQYLTNGGRSIPKLLCFDTETQEELGTWGPRPKAAQELFYSLKEQGLPKEEFMTSIHSWYSEDKTRSMQQELAGLIGKWNS